MVRGGIIINKQVEVLLRKLEAEQDKKYFFHLKPDACRLLHLLVKMKKPKAVLEVGTGEGYSTLLIASASPSTQVYTIEVNPDKISVAKKNFHAAGLKNIHLLEGDALEILKHFNKQVGMIFLDAMKRQYLQYLRLAEKNLAASGVVVADNIISHSEKVQDYVAYVKKHYS